MAEPISFGDLDFRLVSSMDETENVLTKTASFRMLIIGDFSGRGRSGVKASTEPRPGLKPIKVDRDSLDKLLLSLGVEITLAVQGIEGSRVRLCFSELDDFHPDALYQNLEIFQSLKETRKSLHDPAACAAFAKKLQGEGAVATEVKKGEPPEKAAQQGAGSLLDRILDQQQFDEQDQKPPGRMSEWDSFLSGLVTPHLVTGESPREAEMLDALDGATTSLMKEILHHKDFQALEASWQGLSFLLSRLETDEQLEVYLLDMTKKEFGADLLSRDDLSHTALYSLLVEQAVGVPGGRPWSVVAGNYTFEKSVEDIDILGRMAKIVKAAGCPFISGAGDRCATGGSLTMTPDPDDWQPLEDQELEELWQALRQMPEAENIGLALPRFLLRLPYGAQTDPIDTFEFEEMEAVPTHDNYLWANPCYGLLLLLGQSFSRDGSDMQPGSVLELDGLPLHLYREDGESRLKPCAEVLLSQRAAERLFGLGFMPLLSYLNQDMVRLGRFQSIASPLRRIAGPWR